MFLMRPHCGRGWQEVIITTKRHPPSPLPSMSKRPLPCTDECFQKANRLDDLRAGGVQQKGKSGPAEGYGSHAAWFEEARLRKKRHLQVSLWSLEPESRSPQHHGGE
jgi:hypothetical protein